ncbi:MAG: inositol 2-dehydrogenase [Actinomycetaceae bacterium]|nr:inositol 2-dehydrogenase [Actinomycetaceae bacterium]
MVKIGIVGAGRIAQVHAKSIANNPRAQLVAIADPVQEAGEALANQYGVRWLADADDIFNDPEVEAIIICSPTPLHVPHILAAAKAGKPALAEKPIAMDAAAVDQLVKDLEAYDYNIMVGFNRRFDPNFSEIHQRVEAGEIGDLEQLTIISRDPEAPSPEYIAVSGGIFKDMTIHDFDTAAFFLGDIATVTAVGQHLDPEIAKTGDYDAVVIVLTNKDGKVATIINNRHDASGYDQRIEAFGREGSFIAENQRDTTVRAYTATATDAQGPFQHFFLERYAAAFARELDAFLQAVESGEKASPSIADGSRAIHLAEAAEESARTGKTVQL